MSERSSSSSSQDVALEDSARHYIQVHGHRGSKGTTFENSFSSFQEAVNASADYIEFDVHETSDKEFVIMHDPVLHRIGYNLSIQKSTAQTLRKLQLPNGEPIPFLTELVEKFGKKIGFNLEIKQVTHLQLLLSQLDSVTNLLISSFDHHVLRKVKQISDIKTGYIYFWPFPRRLHKALQSKVQAVHPYIGFLTRWGVKKIKKHGLEINTWTHTKAWHDRRAVFLGVDGIIADFPAETIKRLESWKYPR